MAVRPDGEGMGKHLANRARGGVGLVTALSCGGVGSVVSGAEIATCVVPLLIKAHGGKRKGSVLFLIVVSKLVALL